MGYDAVLFDLDGTLLDTLAYIASAANEALARAGLPGHPAEAYRRFIGDGVAMLFRRALPPERAEEGLIESCVAAFRDAYERCWDASTRPYDGVPELLDELAARRLVLAVLSNKRDEFTRRCAERYLGRWPLAAVLGQREGVPRKPDPAGVLEVAGRFVYVGDWAPDMETARQSGMHPAGARPDRVRTTP